MDISQLDQRITLQSRVDAENSRGENAYTFANLATVPEMWANARPLRGREFFAAAQVQSELTAVFTIRYRSDVTETMRVLWNGVPYDIASPPINVNGANEWLELMCVSGVRDGR